MEGSRRGAVLATAVVVCCAGLAGATGCGGGDDEPGAVGRDTAHTADPQLMFAPLVELAANEPWRPMGARWFIERAALWLQEDHGCGAGRIAVGHTLSELQDSVTDWIYLKRLGAQRATAYYRVPNDANCEIDLDRRVFADQLVRPYDPGPRTEAGARSGEGFYLDLVDEARQGEPLEASRNVVVPAYVERTDEGDSRIRLTYWMLFGMHGEPGEPDAHEGDWERVDVLLDDEGDGAYEPLALQLGDAAREIPWPAMRQAGGSHPVVTGARATHALAPARRTARCSDCLEWETWRSVADAREQPWYGFGGAWGDVGPNSATTGPLGPHGFFPSDDDKRREVGDY